MSCKTNTVQIIDNNGTYIKPILCFDYIFKLSCAQKSEFDGK